MMGYQKERVMEKSVMDSNRDEGRKPEQQMLMESVEEREWIVIKMGAGQGTVEFGQI